VQSLTQKLSASLSIWVLFFICLTAFLFLLHGAINDSAVMDELAHIPAGYGYVHNFDFRLNPEHPPLVKAFSALPLLFLNLNFPTQSSYWT